MYDGNSTTLKTVPCGCGLNPALHAGFLVSAFSCRPSAIHHHAGTPVSHMLHTDATSVRCCCRCTCVIVIHDLHIAAVCFQFNHDQLCGHTRKHLPGLDKPEVDMMYTVLPLTYLQENTPTWSQIQPAQTQRLGSCYTSHSISTTTLITTKFYSRPTSGLARGFSSDSVVKMGYVVV